MNVQATILEAKKEDGFIILDEKIYKFKDGDIQPGDLYVAGRNSGPKLLTAKNIFRGCVYSREGSYPFNYSECHRVEEA